MGPLLDAITNDLISDRNKLLFLQELEGRIVFGVKQQLTLRDEVGRLRANFMGYELESHEGPEVIPFYSALQAQFDAITEEAHACHARLDTDPRCGKTLRDMQINFESGAPQPGNRWDEAVLRLRRKPGRSALFIFDEHGNKSILLQGISDELKEDEQRPPVLGRDLKATGTAGKNREERKVQPSNLDVTPVSHHLGIMSSYQLDDSERVHILPPEELIESLRNSDRKKKSSKRKNHGMKKDGLDPKNLIEPEFEGGGSGLFVRLFVRVKRFLLR